MKAMFQADKPIAYMAPVVKRKMPAYGGIAQFVGKFETDAPEPRPKFEDTLARRARLRTDMMATNEAKIAAELDLWNPHKPPPPQNGELTQDAYKTLFVSRLSYDTTGHKLRRELEMFGAIRTLRVVQDGDGKARGYAFIEFEKEADMKEAYKRSDGRKIDGRRVLVDVERGRTVRKWKPRRLGGGLGNTRDNKKPGDKPGPSLSGRAGAGAVTSSSAPSSARPVGQYGPGPGAPSAGSAGGARPKRANSRSRSRSRSPARNPGPAGAPRP
jgi:U1 small nuclear ribonucleoprotein